MEELFEYWGIDTPEVREFLSRRYVERIVGCIENFTNPSCKEPFLKKLKVIRDIIASPRVCNAVNTARPNSKYMTIMLVPIKAKLTFLTYFEGKVISHIKIHNMKVFAELKANR